MARNNISQVTCTLLLHGPLDSFWEQTHKGCEHIAILLINVQTELYVVTRTWNGKELPNWDTLSLNCIAPWCYFTEFQANSTCNSCSRNQLILAISYAVLTVVRVHSFPEYIWHNYHNWVAAGASWLSDFWTCDSIWYWLVINCLITWVMFLTMQLRLLSN